ncbi:MAG: cation diffusion facilitator family transporter, partial [Candidatus Altiarchaeota archaeon]|nr:cation diffusion facilitator family transporter [Candidatus Altiarchaeota archaeon]
MEEKYREVRFVLVYVLFLNIIVALLKVVFGFLANSLSMMADGMHSTFDSLSNIIGLVAVRVASKPPDDCHPYGHSKYENLATLGISVFIFIAAFEIFKTGIERFIAINELVV